MRSLRVLAFAVVFLATSAVHAQGPRVYSGAPATRGYSFGAGPYTHYQFNNGVSGYGITTPHTATYRFNNGARVYGFGNQNFGYYQYSTPGFDSGYAPGFNSNNNPFAFPAIGW